MDKKYICYHISRNDRRLGYGDEREIVLGETLTIDKFPSYGRVGLHGSESVLDALDSGSGSHLWLVEIYGDVDAGEHGVCGRNRTAIRDYGDILSLVVEFSGWCKDRNSRFHGVLEYDGIVNEHAKSAREAELRGDVYEANAYSAAALNAAEYVAAYSNERDAQNAWWAERLATVANII